MARTFKPDTCKCKLVAHFDNSLSRENIVVTYEGFELSCPDHVEWTAQEVAEENYNSTFVTNAAREIMGKMSVVTEEHQDQNGEIVYKTEELDVPVKKIFDKDRNLTIKIPEEFSRKLSEIEANITQKGLSATVETDAAMLGGVKLTPPKPSKLTRIWKILFNA